jgi:VanZ family protein
MEEGGRWIAIPHLDKLVHLILFGGFVGLWWRAVGDSAGRLMVIVAAGVALGVLTELGQAIPGLGRDAGLDDLVADLVGCVLAVALVRWWARRRAEGAARELKQGATVCR